MKEKLTSVHDITFPIRIPIHNTHSVKSTYQNPVLEDLESNTFYLGHFNYVLVSSDQIKKIINP